MSEPGALPPSAEDAVAKAKAIAAKLAAQVGGGGGGASVADASSTKRKRWASSDISSTANDALAAAMAGGGDHEGEKRLRMSSSGDTTSRKVWIPVEKNPGYNFVGLLIGPGGSKQKALQQEAGGRVKIQVRGKGSSSSSTTDGGQEEPLHVLLEGEKACVDKAESLINELLNDTEKADAEKGRQLAEIASQNPTGGGASGTASTSATSHYTPGLGSTPASTYRPAPVAQLIGQTQASTYGAGGAGATTSLIEEQMGIPNGVVGYIIGKGGESITSMQRRTSCRVQIQKEHEMAPGSTTRIITLIASTQESISQCRQIIEHMVAERERLNQLQTNGSGGGGNQYNNAQGPHNPQLVMQQANGQQVVNVQVPDADVGLIIGKGGVTIRSIQERSGANILIPTVGDIDNPLVRTISVLHATLEGANFAKNMVEDILRNKINHHSSTNYGGGHHHTPGVNDSSVQVLIPDKDVGMVIGRQGCVIREMQSKTQTRIQIPSQPTPGQSHRVATVHGNIEGCHQVKAMIERMVLEQSSQSVMAGSAFQGNFGQNQHHQNQNGYYGHQQQQQQGHHYAAAYGQQYGAYGQQYAAAYGQQYYQQQAGGGGSAYGQGGATAAAPADGQKTDYSAEWAAYYAAQAAQQQQQQGGGGSTSTTGTDAAGGKSTQETQSGDDTNTNQGTSASNDNSADGAGGAGNGSSSSGAATPAPTDPTAYYNDFWKYTQYYGEEAARKYYGAWSPPVGTPNPYGSAGGATSNNATAGSQQQAQDASSNADAGN